jgi:hypothetical protein
MRQKHTGADGEVKFVATRGLYVGFMGGRVVVTKRTEVACKNFLANMQGTVASKPAKAVKATASKKARVTASKPERNITPEIKAGAAKFLAYRKTAEQAFAPVIEAEIPDLFDEQDEDRWAQSEKFDREYFSVEMADY